MPCTHLKLPDGTRAIVCGTRGRAKRCATCKAPAPLLCDWKMNPNTVPVQTCDEPMCAAHALEVGPDKHLCPTHQSAWRAHSLFRP